MNYSAAQNMNEILRLHSLRTAHFVARGYRPFYAKKEPLALSPGASNPRMTIHKEMEEKTAPEGAVLLIVFVR